MPQFDDMQKKTLHTVLTITALLAVICAFFASDLRLETNKENLPDFLFYSFTAYQDTILNLTSGYAISVLFYFLLVYLPEKSRRKRLKNRALVAYRSFKRGLISTAIQAAGESWDLELAEKLTDPDELDSYFAQNPSGKHKGNRWYDFKNGLDTWYVSELVLELDFLKEEISHLISNLEIEDDEIFRFLKNLSQRIDGVRRYGAEFDEQRAWANYLKETLSPKDFSTGERIADPIEAALKKL